MGGSEGETGMIDATLSLPKAPTRGRFLTVLRRLWRHRSGRIGLSVLGLIVFLAVFADWVMPYGPLALDMRSRLQPPSWSHWFGTDELGRDILSRITAGTRLFLMVAGVSTAIAAAGGLSLGLLAIAGGKWADMLIMRLVDLMLSFPYVLLLLAVIAVLGPSLVTAMIAVGIASIPGYARLIRGEALAVRESDYVMAMRVLGASQFRITVRTILPNIMSPLVIFASYSMPLAVLSAAALSFLGLGTQPPTPEWGLMLAEGRLVLRHAPWVSAFPGLAITLSVLAVNLLGDALRDALEVHTAG